MLVIIASVPNASNAATAVISSFIWSFDMLLFSQVFFNFSSFFVVFQRLLGGRFRLLAVPPALGASGGAAQSPPAASWPASRLPRGAPPS
jgi:hypothetical protein